MKWYRINESVDEVDIKKLLKQNGISKLPSKSEISKDRIKWYKRGGYSGENTIDAMKEQLENAGWKSGDEKLFGSPDGSSFGRGKSLVSPDGKVKVSFSSGYGSTSRDNYFSITFELTSCNESIW